MSVLPIRVLGDPILREETTPVAEITEEVRTLVANMFETMYIAKGIGLAAPQVGRTERVAVIDVDGEKFAIINPGSRVLRFEDGKVGGGVSLDSRRLWRRRSVRRT